MAMLSVKPFQFVKVLAQYQTSLGFYSGSSGWRGRVMEGQDPTQEHSLALKCILGHIKPQFPL